MDQDTSAFLPVGLKRLPPENAHEPLDPLKRVKTDIMSVIDDSTDTEGMNVLKADVAPPKKEKNISRRRDAAGYAKSRKGKEKDGKNTGRRRGTGKDDSIQGGRERLEMDDHTPKAPRLPKRQCALLIGFCGTGCNGMQMCVPDCVAHIAANSLLDMASPYVILTMKPARCSNGRGSSI